MSMPLSDSWTHDKTYAERYQTSEQIAEVIGGLVLGEANCLLDLGCGNGAFTIAAARQFPSCQIVAIDPLKSATEECQKRVTQAALQNVCVKQASVECLPLQDNCVDRFLMRNVLHHLSDIDIALKESCRVLSPNGLMLIEAPCNIGRPSLAQLLSDVYFIMDSSHRRNFHMTEFILSILDNYGVKNLSNRIWQHPSIMSSQAVSLIHQAQMAEQLTLQKNRDGKWIIKLNFMRIIAQKLKKA